MIPFKNPYQQWRWQRQQKQHRLTQGRLTTAEAAAQLSGDGAIPLASVPDSKKDSLISIPAEVEGHLLLVAPPDSQWRAHLISILVHWPSAALVVDPDGSFYQKTGQFRDTLWGKVYSIPGYRFNLNEYYRCWNGDAAAKLHRFLMWPVPAAETWLLDHSVALIHALGLYSFHHKRNPMQDLLDAAATNLLQVLEALATVPDAWHHGCRFTKGLSPRDALLDADVVHSFALFSQQMQRYQKTYASFTIESVSDVLPKAWTQVKHTLYLTYTMAEMSEMVGLVAALVDGIRRYHHTFGRYRKLLLLMDSTLAQHLPAIELVLAQAEAYGITVILTAVSLQALDTLAADGDGAALAGRFAHQVWYPPHNQQTAAHMSWLYGTQLKSPITSGASVGLPDDLQTEPALTTEELLAWPQERVLVYTRRERPYRFLAERVPMLPIPVRAAPVPPQNIPPPRDYLAWLPPEVVQKPNLAQPSGTSKSGAGNPVNSGNEPVQVETAVSDLTEPSPSVKPETAQPESSAESDAGLSAATVHPGKTRLR